MCVSVCGTSEFRRKLKPIRGVSELLYIRYTSDTVAVLPAVRWGFQCALRYSVLLGEYEQSFAPTVFTIVSAKTLSRETQANRYMEMVGTMNSSKLLTGNGNLICSAVTNICPVPMSNQNISVSIDFNDH